MISQTPCSIGRSILYPVILSLLLGACAQTSVVDNWRTDKLVNDKPDKVAVIVVLPDALACKAVEIDVARVLREKGTPAVPGSGHAYSWGRPYFTGFTDVYTVREGPGWADYKMTAFGLN